MRGGNTGSPSGSGTGRGKALQRRCALVEKGNPHRAQTICRECFAAVTNALGNCLSKAELCTHNVQCDKKEGNVGESRPQ